MTVTAVIWNDAHLNALDEADGGDIVHRPWRYTTVGLLIRTDETGVTLAMDQGEDGKFRTRTFIPRAMIIDEYPIGSLKQRRRTRAHTRRSQSVPAADVRSVDGAD